MIIRTVIILIEILVCFLLQSTVFPQIALAGVVPDLLMILVVSVAFMRGRIKGLLCGLACGLLVDFSFGSIVGLFGLMYMSIGYLAGYSNKIYDENDYTLPLLLVGAAELIYNFEYYIFFLLLRGNLNLGYFVYSTMIPKIVYTVLVSIILYKLFNMINIFMLRHVKA